MRIAVVGSGISGLTAAWLLDRRHSITVYEAADRLGGHSNTVDVPTGATTTPVDTGFIVYNEVNYPNLTRLFAHLDVATEWSDMSFSASIDGGLLEYAGSSAKALFAQRRNALRPDYLRMLVDIWRFNRAGRAFLETGADESMTLGAFLDAHGFGKGIRDWYLLPMGAAIWSAPVEEMLHFPACSFLGFFANHGLLTIAGQHRWRTVSGGSREYVRRLAAPFMHRVRLGTAVTGITRRPWGVEVRDAKGDVSRFDHVVLAGHADTSLGLLEDASPREREVLGRFRFQPNRAVLHGDTSLMPKRKSAWASWNYAASSGTTRREGVAVTYWMNQLQNLDPNHPIFVSMNPLQEPDPALVHREFVYDHPVLDAATLRGQRELKDLQGSGGVWYAGAWTGFGFHEDGMKSGMTVARALGAVAPWEDDLPAPRLGAAAGLPERAAAQAL